MKYETIVTLFFLAHFQINNAQYTYFGLGFNQKDVFDTIEIDHENAVREMKAEASFKKDEMSKTLIKLRASQKLSDKLLATFLNTIGPLNVASSKRAADIMRNSKRIPVGSPIFAIYDDVYRAVEAFQNDLSPILLKFPESPKYVPREYPLASTYECPILSDLKIVYIMRSGDYLKLEYCLFQFVEYYRNYTLQRQSELPNLEKFQLNFALIFLDRQVTSHFETMQKIEESKFDTVDQLKALYGECYLMTVKLYKATIEKDQEAKSKEANQDQI